MAQTTHPGRTSWILHSLEADRTRGLHYASLPYQTSHKTTTKNGIKLLYRRTLEPSPHTERVSRAEERRAARNPSWRSCPLCAGVANPSHRTHPIVAEKLRGRISICGCTLAPLLFGAAAPAARCLPLTVAGTHPEALRPHDIVWCSTRNFAAPRGGFVFVWMRACLFIYSLHFRQDIPLFSVYRVLFVWWKNWKKCAVCPKV